VTLNTAIENLFLIIFTLNKTVTLSIYIQETNLVNISPQANYTDRATAVPTNLMPTFAGKRYFVLSAKDSYSSQSRYSRPELSLFIQEAPQLPSRG
jgi:hypothetical protein